MLLVGRQEEHPACKNRVVGLALPQTPLGELTVLPRPPAVFRGLLLNEWERRGQERRGGERREFVHCPMKKKKSQRL